MKRIDLAFLFFLGTFPNKSFDLFPLWESRFRADSKPCRDPLLPHRALFDGENEALTPENILCWKESPESTEA